MNGASGERLVAVLERRGRFLTATPLFDGAPPTAGRLAVQLHAVQAGEGDVVLLRLGRRRRGAVVERRIGRPDVARDLVEALLLERGAARAFAEDVEREAAEAARTTPLSGRRDLRELATFTIDPRSARDFDDAISAEPRGDATLVHVHIADVAAYVRPGGALDAEARARANSLYAPGAVEPMLPHALSSGACSLLPGVERATVTVELVIDGDGSLASARFYRSLIRSDQRLEYDQVQAIFDGRERAAEPWGAPLAAARRAAAALRERRLRAGALAIDAPEPEYEFDSAGQVEGATMREQNEAHRLIEQLMIAANEAVAELLERRSLPCLFRVHERPEPGAVERLVDQLASLGVATPPLPDPLSPSQAAGLLGRISTGVEQHVARARHGRRALESLVLRSLKPALYAPRNSGHAGLASRAYCHFTSPIRRYPDLVCHRALLAATGGGEAPPERGGLGELAVHCSERERAATALERDCDDRVSALLLERVLADRGWHEPFPGEISGLIGAGAFVAFGAEPEPPFEGLLPVRALRAAAAGTGAREWWELNEQGTILRGESTGATLRLGDTVAVRVERVDAPRGRVDLVPGG